MIHLTPKQSQTFFTVYKAKKKIAIGEEWNKMSKEFILKTWNVFRRRVDTMNEKKKRKKKTLSIFSKFIVLCLPSFVVVFFFFFNQNKSCLIIGSFIFILEYS